MNCKSRYIPAFPGWTAYTPTLPKLYWDVESQEQRIHALCKQLHKLVCYADMLGIKISNDHDAIEELQKDFDTFKASGFIDYYEKQIAAWIAENMPSIISHSIKNVWFGLTLDGHLVAYIPDSWDDLIFDTGYDYNLDTYGRLILRWDVDSSTMVNQTVEANSQGIGA